MENWESLTNHFNRNAYRDSEYKRVTLDSLMRCPLCGAVNSAANTQCFVCTWHGAFDHEPEIVEEGLAELIDNCPDFEELIIDRPAPAPTRGSLIRDFFKKIFWS